MRRRSWRVVVGTFAACLRYRVTGLAAEAAFFAILSLPPLVFGLAGAVGFVAQRFDVTTVTAFRDQVLALSLQLLTPAAVSGVLLPTLDDVLSSGRFEVISIGFVLALWSGSRALNVVLDTVTIMYGLAGQRSILRTRAVVLPLPGRPVRGGRAAAPRPRRARSGRPGAAGPALGPRRPLLAGRAARHGRRAGDPVPPGRAGTTTLAPRPARSRPDPAALTLLPWLGGSALLRFVLERSVETTSIYGPLAAPIAVLLWLYLISLALLVGAAFNASLDPDGPPRLSSQNADGVPTY